MRLNILILFIPIVMIGVSCAPQKPDTLKSAFKDKYLIGTALNISQFRNNDTRPLQIAEKQFNCITPENMLKWERVHPAPGVYNFGPVDTLMAYCQKNNLKVIGHTLVWHNQTPAWVFKDDEGNPASRDTLLNRLKEHIFTVVGRYKGKIHGWDVINEAFNEEGKLRNTPWMDIIGKEYIEIALQWTHEADPQTELYYNDFNMWYKSKSQAVVEMVKDFRQRNVPIDGIGLQGHWGLNYPTIDELNETFDIYSGLGIDFLVTELELDMLPRPEDYEGADINKSFEAKKALDPWPDGLPDSMQTVIAERYAEIFSVFNKYSSSISRITLWGVDDGQSWRNYWPIYTRTAYPLLFDRNYQPKKAFYAVIKTVEK
jgi:endo-1,4-beta-xylanase